MVATAKNRSRPTYIEKALDLNSVSQKPYYNVTKFLLIVIIPANLQKSEFHGNLYIFFKFPVIICMADLGRGALESGDITLRNKDVGLHINVCGGLSII